MTTRFYTPQRRLSWLYPLAQPLVSFDEWQRANHQDLTMLTTPQLMREVRCVRRRLDYDPTPHPWLAERIDAIRGELRRREHSQ
jgi:hypothetical protein